jgi:hypothetical protein
MLRYLLYPSLLFATLALYLLWWLLCPVIF